MRFRRKLLRRYPHGRFVLMLLYFGSNITVPYAGGTDIS